MEELGPQELFEGGEFVGGVTRSTIGGLQMRKVPLQVAVRDQAASGRDVGWAAEVR